MENSKLETTDEWPRRAAKLQRAIEVRGPMEDTIFPTITIPAAIAGKLTPYQQRALLWLPDDGSERAQDETPRLGTGLFGIAAKSIGQDIVAHLATYKSEMRMIAPGKWAPNRWRATKLGLQVRKVLCDGR